MKQRCFNKNHKSYPRYGARGITVCDSWRDSSAAFLADMGPRPDGCSLDRIDNDGNYSPENCRWATRRQQQMNRCNTAHYTIRGVTMHRNEWAALYGINPKTVQVRMHRGLSILEALIKPVKHK